MASHGQIRVSVKNNGKQKNLWHDHSTAAKFVCWSVRSRSTAIFFIFSLSKKKSSIQVNGAKIFCLEKNKKISGVFFIFVFGVSHFPLSMSSPGLAGLYNDAVHSIADFLTIADLAAALRTSTSLHAKIACLVPKSGVVRAITLSSFTPSACTWPRVDYDSGQVDRLWAHVTNLHINLNSFQSNSGAASALMAVGSNLSRIIVDFANCFDIGFDACIAQGLSVAAAHRIVSPTSLFLGCGGIRSTRRCFTRFCVRAMGV